MAQLVGRNKGVEYIKNMPHQRDSYGMEYPTDTNMRGGAKAGGNRGENDIRRECHAEGDMIGRERGMGHAEGDMVEKKRGGMMRHAQGDMVQMSPRPMSNARMMAHKRGGKVHHEECY